MSIQIRRYLKMKTLFKNFLISFLVFYKKGLSPYLPHACRYQPTCSEYMIEAIRIHGVLRGTFLGIKRLLRCHPWGKSGFDPVPLPDDKKTLHKGSD